MSYDAQLLAQAPQVSAAEKQEGYDVDILNQHPVRRQPSLPYPATASTSPGPEKRARPRFWQTTAGRIALALLLIVLVGAIVGGAVGGSLSKKHPTTAASLDADSSKSSSATISLPGVTSPSSPLATQPVGGDQPVSSDTDTSGQPVPSGPVITKDPNQPEPPPP